MESMEDIISTLTNIPDLIDDLSDREVDFLIDYLKNEIKKKEIMLKEMEAN